MRSALSGALVALFLITPLSTDAVGYGIPAELRGKVEKPVGRSLYKKPRAAMAKEARRFKKPFATPVAYKTYRNEQYGITIGYPSNWSVADAYMETVVSFLSPRTGKKDALTENVNILVDKGDGKTLLLGAATEQALEELRGLENFQLLESESTVHGRREARAITYTSGSDTVLKFKQVWLLNRGDLYIFTFVAGPLTFSEYVRHFNRMLGTLELQ